MAEADSNSGSGGLGGGLSGAGAGAGGGGGLGGGAGETVAAMTDRVLVSFERQAMMATLGARLTAVERGRVRIVVGHDDRFTQQHGFLHAGAVSAVLDSACGYAAFSVMPPEAAVLTVTYTVNLLAPAAGRLFTMTGDVVRAGRTLVVCRGEATADDASTPFAVMQSTLTAVYGRPGIAH